MSRCRNDLTVSYHRRENYVMSYCLKHAHFYIFQNEIRKYVVFLCDATASLEGAEADMASGSLQVDFFPVSVSIYNG